MMKEKERFDVIIVGGGLGGLTAALHLSKNNLKICLIEKDIFPHHKVCGEYVSNEVLSYLQSLGIFPFENGAKKIEKFEITDTSGNVLKADLPLGGFGISRFYFDNILYEALKKTATVLIDTVDKIEFLENQFLVVTKSGKTMNSDFVVGAFGKRSNLDVHLKRRFISHKSSWLAVKSHYEYDFPEDTVMLHNFTGGYCGLSKTETNAVNACYLTTYKSFKKYGNINDHQRNELSKNPALKEFFDTAKPLFKKPLTISQISFEEKLPVENHIFMIGDSAGLIHPLCGNGMAIAIRSAKIFCDLFLAALSSRDINRERLEKSYSVRWQTEFGQRLYAGRLIQKALTNTLTTKIGFSALKMIPSLLPKIIQKTHGAQLK